MESDKNDNQLLQSAPIGTREKVENEEDKNSQNSIKTESVDEEEL